MKKSRSLSPLLNTLRSIIKGSDFTYEDLGKKLKLSTISVKRLLSGATPITLDRIEEICNVLEIDFYELAKLSKYGTQSAKGMLTLEQEKALAEDDRMFSVFYLAVMGMRMEEIGEICNFTKDQVLKLVLKLESFGILELHPKDKMKIKVYRKSRWNFNGPLHRKHMVAMATDFAETVFVEPDAYRFFFNCPLSFDSKTKALTKLREVSAEIERLSEVDMAIENRAETSLSILIGARTWFPPAIRQYQKKR